MIKASALHLTLVIVLVITVFLGSLIYLHFFYRSEEQRMDRWDALEQDIQAGIAMALSADFPHSLGDSLLLSPLTWQDSLRIAKKSWGFFDAVSVYAWRGADSLKRGFLSGIQVRDSTALYIVDEDRPLSISGKAVIQGIAFIPQSGIRPAFVDGEYYQGIEKMVDGQIRESRQTFPDFETERIAIIKNLYDRVLSGTTELPPNPDNQATFFGKTRYAPLKAGAPLLADSVSGNRIIIADSAVNIPAGTRWEDAILIAPYIKLEDGFAGSGQFIAFDSLAVGKDVTLRYPSVVALLTADSTNTPLTMRIGENSQIQGLVLLHRKDLLEGMDMLEIHENVSVEGELVSFGLLKYTAPLTVHGGVYAQRLVTQRPSSLYENYLININFENGRRHPHYIAPFFWKSDRPASQKIVKWLN